MTNLENIEIDSPPMKIEQTPQEENLDFSGNPISADQIPNQNQNINQNITLDYSGNPILQPETTPVRKSDVEQEKTETQKEENEESLKRIGRTGTFFNLINILIGAGIVSVPATFTTCGIGPTVLLLVISCFLCNIASTILVTLQHDFNCKGINEVAFRILGKWGMNVISICLIIFCLSCTVAYIIIANNQLTSWLSLAGLGTLDAMWQRAIIIIIYVIVLPGWMTFPRHLSILSYMSIPSVLGCVLFVIAIVIKGCQYLVTNGTVEQTVKGIEFGLGIFTAFGVHALTFNIQIVMSPIIAPYNPSVRKRSRILGFTFMTCFFIVLFSGLFGYIMFGDNTKSDILTSFPDDDVFIIIVRIGLFISVSASYPAIVLSIVGSLGQMIWNESIPEEMPTKHRLILIPLVNIFNALLAILLPDIKPILGVGGSLGGCVAGFAMPSICRLVSRTTPLSSPNNIGHILFAIFGIFAAILCTYSSVVDAIAALS